ncbi:MAG: NUDIX domain-containing protein [Candidatus Absconditabacterales bacterium]
MKTKTGLFITRCQPGLHSGQVDGIRQAIAQGIKKIIIGIGSANKEFTSENPFTYEERKHMIELSAQALLQNIEVEIFPVPDLGDNEKWREYILNNLPEFHYVMTGNARVQEVFKDTDKVIIPLEIKEFVKGSTIRGNLATRNIEALEKALPQGVIRYLGEIKAFQRLREIFNAERKTPSLVVDMVLINEKGKVILIDRKNFPEGIALPGGFVDYGETGTTAVIREAKEETGLDIEIEKELGTRDDPNRDPRAHNISRAFKGKIIGGELKAADDAKAIITIDPQDLDTINFAFPDHKEMILAALCG